MNKLSRNLAFISPKMTNCKDEVSASNKESNKLKTPPLTIPQCEGGTHINTVDISHLKCASARKVEPNRKECIEPPARKLGYCPYTTIIPTCIPTAEAIYRTRQNEKAAFEVISKALQFYKPDEILFAFNGGKDCTVLLDLLIRVYKSLCLRDINMPVLYIQDYDAFEEVDQFVKDCAKIYHIEVITRQGNVKDVVTEICDEMPHIKAVFMGSRRTDPYCDKLQVMQAADNGWPKVMRINPIIDWSYQDIWDYIFVAKVPYCVLYEEGFTSLGNRNNTRPNPNLKIVNPKPPTKFSSDRTCTSKKDCEGLRQVTYLPAYRLEDGSLERAGRL